MSKTDREKAGDLIDYLVDRAVSTLTVKLGRRKPDIDQKAVSNLVRAAVQSMHNKKLEEHMDKVSIITDVMSANPLTI